jgi:hypothetical protein
MWGRREIHTGFWWGNEKERGLSEELGVNGRRVLKWILKYQNGFRGLD